MSFSKLVVLIFFLSSKSNSSNFCSTACACLFFALILVLMAINYRCNNVTYNENRSNNDICFVLSS